MSNSLARFFRSLRASSPQCPVAALPSGFFLITFFAPELLAAAPPGDELAAGDGESSSWILAVLFGISLLLLAGLIIGGLVLWSKKQEDVNYMMSFCIKFLIDTQLEGERCEAAKALGGTKDPGALLVLIDVINDENAEESVRAAALAALQQMGLRYRKYRKVIEDLTAAVRDQDHHKFIDLLTSMFEGE